MYARHNGRLWDSMSVFLHRKFDVGGCNFASQWIHPSRFSTWDMVHGLEGLLCHRSCFTLPQRHCVCTYPCPFYFPHWYTLDWWSIIVCGFPSHVHAQLQSPGVNLNDVCALQFSPMHTSPFQSADNAQRARRVDCIGLTTFEHQSKGSKWVWITLRTIWSCIPVALLNVWGATLKRARLLYQCALDWNYADASRSFANRSQG